jgi:hypothetical protein
VCPVQAKPPAELVRNRDRSLVECLRRQLCCTPRRRRV